MEVDLFIHGVPHGWDFWGKESDRSYFGNFYKPTQAARQLVVETRVSGGRAYAYYHYLLNADVVDYDGRDGSYVGVTVRVDAYCLPYRYMWMVLDRLFSQRLRPLLFGQAGPKLRWRVAALRQADKQLADAQEHLLELLGAMLRATDFEPIGHDIAARTNTGIDLCTVDATDQQVQQAVAQYGRVSVSGGHPSERERQAQAANQKQQNALKNSIQQLQATNRQLQYEAQQTQAELKRQVQTQQAELQRLQQELRRSEANRQRALDAADGQADGLFGLPLPPHVSRAVVRWAPLCSVVLLVLTIILLCTTTCGGKQPASEQPAATDSAAVTTVRPDSATMAADSARLLQQPQSVRTDSAAATQAQRGEGGSTTSPSSSNPKAS